MQLTKDSDLNILEEIREIGAPARCMEQLHRRILKLGEEFGEVTEAYLAITSPGNYKNITPADLREELVDVVIVALDVMLHRVPGEENLSDDELGEALEAVFAKKLAKWRRVAEASSSAKK